ncbi:unnamed protein product [Sphenostylis stenocarpa]|uniref:VQ domain-containing protein n=1 Tax=Sphenostylis stenocarpa TaxID=92480 RepID=A0AA86TL86_9FABA|nr:unnamed protein product [Sphenostylis stenocarpa]
MDSGNSGSISSSGDEEYDSRPDHTVLPPTFLNNHPSQFGSISHPLVSSSHYQHHHPQPSLFDLSSSYLHALSQHNSSNPNSFLHLDTATSSSSQPRRSEPDCTDPSGVNVNINVTSSPQTTTNINQCLLGPQVGLPTYNARSQEAVLLEPGRTVNNVGRNSKKRTRASRRAPTTVLTTDTSNFRAMVQEFTGIPAPPFSASSSYSRRLDLLTGSSSLRSSSHLDTTTGPFYPLRPSPQKVHHHHQHHQNPLLVSSSSSPYNNMVDAIASTTTTNNSSSNNSNNPINYQQLPPDLGLPYHHNQQNIMLSMQNHPNLAFHHPPLPLHPFGHAGFGAKLPSIEDLGMSHGQVNNNANFVASGVSMPLRSVNDDGGGTRDVSLRSFDGGGSCKLNFSVASASTSLNHEKSTLQNNSNNNNPTTRGEGTVDSWICSSD